jgi:pimeloyl-ACP methyl ester carboxylesterase
MIEVQHRFVAANGIQMHFVERGAGPLVVLCHGFPESWYSWRHQIEGLADAGYRVIAPDMRGYGQTDAPDRIDQYTLFHLVGDMVALLDAIGADTAVIAGHDWGAPVAWNSALLRPDRFKAVIALSVPHRPRGTVRPVMPRTETAVFYQLYFQEPGAAERELETDVRASIRDILLRLCGDVPLPEGPESFAMVPLATGLRGRMEQFADMPLPAWLTEADLSFYVREFERTGFHGGLNWYRNIIRNWELMAPLLGAKVMVPALYVAGDRDLVLRNPGVRDVIDQMGSFVPALRQKIILPGCGHWTQQERPGEVNEAMIGFLRGL